MEDKTKGHNEATIKEMEGFSNYITWIIYTLFSKDSHNKFRLEMSDWYEFTLSIYSIKDQLKNYVVNKILPTIAGTTNNIYLNCFVDTALNQVNWKEILHKWIRNLKEGK